MDLKRTMVNLMPGPLVKIFAAPYVGGASIQEALDCAKQFWDTRKVCSTIDLLGEELDDDTEVQYTVQVYEKLIDQLGRQPHATVSLKPTQLGSHRGKEHCREIIEGLVQKAAAQDLQVTIDMEDHTVTDMTLDIYRSLKAQHPNVGTVLQSRLFRTTDDIRSLKGLEAKIRICIGIYNEPAAIALQNKTDMKKKLLEHVEILLQEGHYAEIATHEEWVIREALNIAERLGAGKNRYEVQMLMGVPRQTLQDELVANGVKVRLYVPFAEKWKFAISYCKRRLAANPMMAVYVTKNMLHVAAGRK
jgi:proline dehydrogenase